MSHTGPARPDAEGSPARPPAGRQPPSSPPYQPGRRSAYPVDGSYPSNVPHPSPYPSGPAHQPPQAEPPQAPPPRPHPQAGLQPPQHPPYGAREPRRQPEPTDRRHATTEQRPHPGVLAGVTIWRLLIAGCGLFGYVDALNTQAPGRPLLQQMATAGPFLSQIGSLVIGLFYLGFALYPLCALGRRHEPANPWLRGQLAILMLLIAVPYNTIMGGSLDSTWEMLEHVVTPLLVLIDWIVVGRNQARTRWWHPFGWMAFPLVYLYCIIVYRAPNYRMFPPESPDFFVRVAGGMVGVLLMGYLLFGIGHGVAAIKRSIDARAD